MLAYFGVSITHIYYDNNMDYWDINMHTVWSFLHTNIYIWLRAKRCACKGLCTSVENKTLLKTVFISNVVLCTCMNEWIYSTYNFSNQAVVDFKIQSSHTEKALKNDCQKQTSMYWVIFVTAYKQTASTWNNNHWFVPGNIVLDG